MLTQQKIAFEKNKDRLSGKITCLVDSVDKNGKAEGRFFGQAPDIDSVCIIKNSPAASCRKTGAGATPGQFIQTRVIASKAYDLIVKQI